MNKRIIFIGLIASAAATFADAQVDQLDYNGVYRTHIRTRNTNNGGGGVGGNENAYQSVPAAFGGTPYSPFTPPARITTSGPEAEEHIAAHPAFPGFAFASISDFSIGGTNCSKYAWTNNYGTSWTDSFVPLNGSNMRITGDGLAWPYNSDPVQAIANDGTIYFSNLYFGSGNDGGLYVSVSSVSNPVISAANTFGVQVHPSPTSPDFEDKQWIAVDNSTSIYSGTVYVSWTRFTSTSNMIMVSKSTNHGATWSAPMQVSSPSVNGAVQGSQVAVGPDGSVYVVHLVSYVGSKGIQWITKSTNGGTSWSTPVQATPQFNMPTFNSTYRKNSFCQMNVSPTTGKVGIVYPDQPSKSAGAEVRFVTSTTSGGTTFTAPLTINDVTTGQQFFPALAVDSSGAWHARWVDTRNGSKTSTNTFDCYATRSTDGGTTWTANTRVSASSWTTGSSTFIGDYSGIAAANGRAYVIWTNGLNGSGTGLNERTLN